MSTKITPNVWTVTPLGFQYAVRVNGKLVSVHGKYGDPDPDAGKREADAEMRRLRNASVHSSK